MKLTKKLAKKVLSNVKESDRFYCNNGIYLSNLYDLWKEMENMDDRVFSYHARQGRNDFSSWIGDCLGDSKLAEDLVGLGRRSSWKKIGARISYIEKYLEKQR